MSNITALNRISYQLDGIGAPSEEEAVFPEAPVSKTLWSCSNLPEGLSLSSSGILSGRPTTAGSYECEVSVSTNWGTDTKNIRIVIG